jgi:ABC-type bacteriocin/lantibiotic exporter with double-glycine peptidase domain
MSYQVFSKIIFLKTFYNNFINYLKNMEELSEETTRNLKEEKNDEKMNSKNVLLRRESTLENADFESEEEKLKKSNTNYSKSQLIVKSMKVSLLNWKYILYTRLTSIFFDILDMYIPVQRGLIIDCITDKSKNHLLYQNFITVVKFIIIKLIFELIFQYIQRYFINDSLYDYKDILLEDMAKKDIEFYDLYKTGELLEKL